MLQAAARVVLLAVLAGCAVNDQVAVGAYNETAEPQQIELTATWHATDGTTQVLGAYNGTLAAGAEQTLFSFQRPCERLGAGAILYEATLDNGTRVAYRQAWPADGCAAQHVGLVLASDHVRFDAAYA